MKGPITIESLAVKVESLSTSIDDLAGIVQEGFQGLEQRMNQRLESLEHGQEDIRLRLSEAAYRFELVELQHRVGQIEQQIGMTK